VENVAETLGALERIRRADHFYRSQDFPKVLEMLREALPVAQKEFGEESWPVLQILEFSTRVLLAAQREAEFEKSKTAIQTLFTKMNGADPQSAAFANALIFDAAFGEGQYSEDSGFAQIQKGVAILSAVHGPTHRLTGQAMSLLAERLDGPIDKNSEAILTYEQALALLEKSIGPDHPDLVQLLKQLGTAYTRGAVTRIVDVHGNLEPNPPVKESSPPEAVALYEKALQVLTRSREMADRLAIPDPFLYYVFYAEADALRFFRRTSESDALSARAARTLKKP